MASDASDDGLSGLDVEVPDETVAPLVWHVALRKDGIPISMSSQWSLWVGSHQHDSSINMTSEVPTAIERPRPDAGRSSRMSPGSAGSAGTHVLSSPGHRESEESDENEESQETAPVIT